MGSHLFSNMGRRFLSAEIALNGKSVWINTVHLESLLNREVRINQLKNIFGDYMKTQMDSLFMGDFNFGDYTAENEHLSKEYIDCWKEYVKMKKNRGDTMGCQRYDRILLKSKIWNVSKFEIIGKPNMPSDHLGVVVTINC